MYSCFRPKDNFHTIHNEVLTMISLDAVVTYEALFSVEKKKGWTRFWLIQLTEIIEEA